MEDLSALIFLIGIIVLPVILYRSFDHIGSTKSSRAGFAAFGTTIILLIAAFILNNFKG